MFLAEKQIAEKNKQIAVQIANQTWATVIYSIKM